MLQSFKQLFRQTESASNDDNDAELYQIWPKRASVLEFSAFGKELLQKSVTVPKPDANKITIKSFMETSAEFPLKFGTDTCRVMNQPEERYPAIAKQIASAYPVIHERVLWLYLAFLEHKCKYGTNIERALYHGMSLTAFVQRLLEKRCASFVGPLDHYLLINGKTGLGKFYDVGTINEEAPFLLKYVLSYDEMKLSAFLSVSSFTEFLNDGNRKNAGVIEEDKSKIERDGVIVGIIGARFQAREAMDWQDIIITSEQNRKERGYGYTPQQAMLSTNPVVDYRRMWSHFYEQQDLLYSNISGRESARFYKIPNTAFIFDNLMMKKRNAISFDTLLLEANARGVAANKQVYLHVVGIGLGAWRAVQHQDKIFLETFGERLQELLSSLSHISVVHFSYFGMSSWAQLEDGGVIASPKHPSGGIKIFLSNRNPAQKLAPEFENMLVVESYAWDGNALPGNEFWLGSLTSSGDPAAACSTLITELHNPHINTSMVNGANVHVATELYGVLHISEYAKKMCT
ncbi:uncharacterized protein LOC118748798 isoform X1 [Rhagoletis pomonella]|uniref:uncharacterized protein LOC118748798 isoform X1 n=1 Tax=Rhagoletis pomonella TaxID=28610 RepID=UPI001783040A|nr:uncharacterized protein LOC118748798 isoform X1 [Rhagoletis pomonella]